MQVERLLQPLRGQSGELLRSEIGRFAGAGARLTLVSAWFKVTGISRLFRDIGDFRAAGGYVLAVSGIDLRGTSREALDLITRFSDESYVVHDTSQGGRSFHPKLYFVADRNRAFVLSGSGNFTQGGLFTNYETFDVFRFDLGDPEDALFFQAIETEVADLIADAGTAKPLDAHLIAQLVNLSLVVDEIGSARGVGSNVPGARSIFGARPGLPGAPPPQITLPRGTPRPPSANRPSPPAISAPPAASFADAIAGNALPGQIQGLWVEAGAMTTGYARNQIEFPRGTCQFFGLPHPNYESRAVVQIGQPILIYNGKIFTDRNLKWHGDNQMERMNLPTLLQGGPDYTDTIVLFRRSRGGRFRLEVAPTASGLAQRWIASSVAHGAMFRLSARSPRRWGVF